MKLRSLFVALLIYLPTLALVPQYVYLIYCVVPFLFYKHLNLKTTKSLVIIFIIFLLSTINQLINSGVDLELSRSTNQYISYSIFILFIYLSIPLIDRETLKYILIFISIEVLIGLIEHIVGIPYIIKPEQLADGSHDAEDLLYYQRVHGLSKALSLFAQKIFAGILILNFINVKKKSTFYSYWVVLIIGLYITFNRTAIGASIIFILLVLSINIVYKRNSNVYISRLITFAKIIVLTAVCTLVVKFDTVINQFNRGRETTDFSKRDEVYPYYLDYINDHLLFGNGSYKLLLNIGGKAFHAHNSFLATFASNGIIIFFFYMLLVVVNLRRSNYIFVLPILAYSLLQFGIFWGISFLDIIFFFFLFNRRDISLLDPAPEQIHIQILKRIKSQKNIKNAY